MATVVADPVRTPPGVVVAIAAAWLACVAAQVSGHAALFRHDRLIEGGLPLTVALVVFVAAWQLMIAAMMLPSALPMIRLYAGAAAPYPRAGEARAAFIAGYVVVWTTFGALAFSGDTLLHRTVDANPWLGARPWLVAGSLLVLAGAAQFLPLTEHSLRSCRHPLADLETRFQPGARIGFQLGRGHGISCLGCCWSLMLVMFAAGVASLAWMATLTAVMAYEKVGPRGDRLTRAVGLGLIAWGAVVIIHPTGVPAL